MDADGCRGFAQPPAENLTLGVTGTANLTIADATSGHTSDTVAFTLNSLLAVFDAIHAHAAGQPDAGYQ